MKTTNWQKNSIVELNITSLGSSGEGVGRVEGFAVFVKGALPGERVQAKLTFIKKSYAQGQLLKVMTLSPDRVRPVCPVYERCGGCQLQHLSYEGQLTVKRQQVVDALERLGHFKGIAVERVISADEPHYYRNKMQVPVAGGKKGQIAIGCFAQATHEVINVDKCFIQNQLNNQIAAVLRQWMTQYKITALREDERTGIIRHIMGRVGVRTGEVMAVVITNTPVVPHLKELGKMLQSSITGFTTLVQNINTRHTNVIMGEKNRVITGSGFIRDKLGAFSFNISPQSFFQVNTKQAEKLYETALTFAALTGKENVVDVYCGTGTITLFLAQKAKQAVGIEIVAAAIRDAKANAKQNGVKNAHFICGDAAEALPELLAEGVRPDVIILDPPRAGCEERVVRTITSVKPERIVYVSCNPATLARDLAIMCGDGYKIKKVQPVDMFPQTAHVETVVLMSRVQK